LSSRLFLPLFAGFSCVEHRRDDLLRATSGIAFGRTGACAGEKLHTEHIVVLVRKLKRETEAGRTLSPVVVARKHSGRDLRILAIEILIDHPLGLHQATSRPAAVYIDGPNLITCVRQPSDILEENLRVQFIRQRYLKMIREGSQPDLDSLD